MPKEQFYDVTMTVEVTSRVLATSIEEAIENADTGDMYNDIQTGSGDKSMKAKATGQFPDVYDQLDKIAEQICRYNTESMHWLRDLYAPIAKFNAQQKKQGLPEYTPRPFNRMTDSFVNDLKGEK